LIDKNNYWEFKEMPSTNKDAFFESLEITDKMLSYTKELKDLFESQNGIWVIDKSKEAEPNFDTLDEFEQVQIETQIKLLIDLKYTFINYNGINKKRWAGYTSQNTINPFDHSVIIIDEVHNFVSRIVNKIRIQKKSVSTEIYDAILNAEDCKVVCLSGTPFINYPCELGTLFNIIGGYTGTGKTLLLHELRRLGNSVIDLEALACHKGSAFGALGENPQPSQEMFENLLAVELSSISHPINNQDFNSLTKPKVISKTKVNE
jgi:hypothetical protein